MRLSEKTLELNICSQATAAATPAHRLIWFGLTQTQEARAGFDACVKLGGRLLLFQFKASRQLPRTGERKFFAPHAQLRSLMTRAGSHRRSVFYAFPLVGTTRELHTNPDLLAQTWLLDVSTIPPMPSPTTARGKPRYNHCHNVYVVPGRAEIRSDPERVEIISFRSLSNADFSGSDGFIDDRWQNVAAELSSADGFSLGAYGLILY